MENLPENILRILIFIAGILITNLVSSFLKSKGENFATKQDITKITEQVENVKTEYRKKIDDYKQELNVKMENLRFEQNQLMTNFELYTAMRHECYPELYKLIEVSDGATRGLRGLSSEPTFMNVDKEDIESYLKDRKITKYDTKEILNRWDEEKSTAIIILRKTIERIDYKIAEEKFHDARNYFLTMNLYLSDDVEETGNTLFDKMHFLLFKYDPILSRAQTLGGGTYFTDEARVKDEIDSLKEELKLKMKQELLP